jgi:hypothetical protein
MPTGGVRKDLSRRLVPPEALAEAENWIVLRGNFQVRPGMAAFADDTTQRIMGFTQYTHAQESDRLVIGTTDGWFRYDTSTLEWVDITEAANELNGGTTAHALFRVFERGSPSVAYLLGVNGVDAPKKWDGDVTGVTDYEDIEGSPPAAPKAIAVCFNRCILLDGKTIYVSAYNDFDDGWDTTLIKMLLDTPGDGVGLMEMGTQQFAAYKTDAIYVGVAYGGTAPFQITLRCAGIMGPCSPAAIVSLPDGSHAYLGIDGQVYIFNGMNPQAVGDHAREWVTQTADIPALGLASGFFDQTSNLLWFFYPQAGYTDCNAAIALQLPTFTLWPMRWETLRPTCGKTVFKVASTSWGQLVGTWGQQVLTWAGFSRKQSRTLIGEKTGQAYEQGGSADNSAAIPAYFETGLMDGGDAITSKTLTEIDHLASASGSQVVDVSVGVCNYGEDRVLQAPVSMTVAGGGPRITGHRVSGVAFSHRWSAAATVPFGYQGGAMRLKLRGKR